MAGDTAVHSHHHHHRHQYFEKWWSHSAAYTDVKFFERININCRRSNYKYSNFIIITFKLFFFSSTIHNGLAFIKMMKIIRSVATFMDIYFFFSSLFPFVYLFSVSKAETLETKDDKFTPYFISNCLCDCELCVVSVLWRMRSVYNIYLLMYRILALKIRMKWRNCSFFQIFFSLRFFFSLSDVFQLLLFLFWNALLHLCFLIWWYACAFCIPSLLIRYIYENGAYESKDEKKKKQKYTEDVKIGFGTGWFFNFFFYSFVLLQLCRVIRSKYQFKTDNHFQCNNILRCIMLQ